MLAFRLNRPTLSSEYGVHLIPINPKQRSLLRCPLVRLGDEQKRRRCSRTTEEQEVVNECVVTWPCVLIVDAGYLLTPVEYTADAKCARYDADDDTVGRVSAPCVVKKSGKDYSGSSESVFFPFPS